MIETIAYTTTSYFSYKPTQDAIRAQVAKNLSLSLNRVPHEIDKNVDQKMIEEF
jgi:hypothetical protein